MGLYKLLYIERSGLCALDAPVKSHVGIELQGGANLETSKA